MEQPMPKSANSAPAAAAAESAASRAEPRDHNPMAATPEEIAKNIHFEALYGKWLMARAKFNSPGPESEDDETLNAQSEAEYAALRELVTTPAPSEGAVWFKIEALDVELDREAQAGERFAFRTNIILAAIKADLLNLNFGH
jgi:hypothetical protein